MAAHRYSAAPLRSTDGNGFTRRDLIRYSGAGAAGAAAEPETIAAASAKTERLRLSSFDFIRPSQILTGDAGAVGTPAKAGASRPHFPFRPTVPDSNFEAMIARGVARGEKQ
jgi:hypothetical protein